MKVRLGIGIVAALSLAACGGSDDARKPALKGLAVQTSAHNGEGLQPAFDPEIHEYTLKVQSDTFGVLLQPSSAAADAKISVTAATTAGAYSLTTPATDENKSEDVPLAQTLGNSGYMVKLSQSYAAYDVEYVQRAAISVTDPSSGQASTYNVRIVRDNDSAIRAKFGAEKSFAGSSGASIRYRIYYPPNYASSSKKYPVVLALHGIGQRAAGGQPSDMVLKRTKQATIWAQDSELYPEKEAIVIAPQANTGWAVSGDASGTLSPDGQAAYELLLSVLGSEKVDPARVYLTGLSLGGNGSLVMAESHPQTFAAVFVNAAFSSTPDQASAGYNWAAVKQHLDGRIRIVAAEDDPDVKHASYLQLVEQLTSNGINFQNKLYPSGTFFAPTAHFVWIAGYADKSARDWVFSLKR